MLYYTPDGSNTVLELRFPLDAFPRTSQIAETEEEIRQYAPALIKDVLTLNIGEDIFYSLLTSYVRPAEINNDFEEIVDLLLILAEREELTESLKRELQDAAKFLLAKFSEKFNYLISPCFYEQLYGHEIQQFVNLDGHYKNSKIYHLRGFSAVIIDQIDQIEQEERYTLVKKLETQFIEHRKGNTDYQVAGLEKRVYSDRLNSKYEYYLDMVFLGNDHDVEDLLQQVAAEVVNRNSYLIVYASSQWLFCCCDNTGGWVIRGFSEIVEVRTFYENFLENRDPSHISDAVISVILSEFDKCLEAPITALQNSQTPSFRSPLSDDIAQQEILSMLIKSLPSPNMFSYDVGLFRVPAPSQQSPESETLKVISSATKRR